MTKAAWYEPLLERDLVPDWMVRSGIRRLIAQRLREEDKGDPQAQHAHLMAYVYSFGRQHGLCASLDRAAWLSDE